MLARNIPLKAVATEKSSKAWKYFVKIDDSSRIILENRGIQVKSPKISGEKLKVSAEQKTRCAENRSKKACLKGNNDFLTLKSRQRLLYNFYTGIR